MKSILKGFYKLPLQQRRLELSQASDVPLERLQPLWNSDSIDPEIYEHMIENYVGTYSFPVGICTYLRVNHRDYLVPMAIEESSVVAAASNGAKMLRSGGGIIAEASEPIMIGQIQFGGVRDLRQTEEEIYRRREEIFAEAGRLFPSWVRRGGGLKGLEVRTLPPLSDGSDRFGPFLVVHLYIDVRDAMGANAVNSFCEALAPLLEQIVGKPANLRILSNLSDRRLVRVLGSVKPEALAKGDAERGREVALKIEEASVFAERDPYRAATHNKGIMNGIDAVLLATGQDFRAVEAGVHAYAARNGYYSSLSRWRFDGELLRGEMTIPLAVGTVGGIAKVHPGARAALDLIGAESASELAQVIAAVGLAQNLAALRALADEGIQRGHMKLHAKNIAIQAGAQPHELDELVEKLNEVGNISHSIAEKLLQEMRKNEK